MDIYRKCIQIHYFFVKNCSVKVLTDFIGKFIQMSYSYSCADKIQKGGRHGGTKRAVGERWGVGAPHIFRKYLKMDGLGTSSLTFNYC